MNRKEKTYFESIKEFIKTIIFALLIAGLIRTLFFQPFWIPSGSMKPNLLIGDYIFVNKFVYGYSKYSCPFSLCPFEGRLFYTEPKRGDVIVFKTPSDNRTDYIKRMIGKSGDEIQFIKGDLYVNKKKIFKEFIRKGTVYCGRESINVNIYKEKINQNSQYEIAYFEQNSLTDTDPYIVPKNHFFFLGDNRDCSKDSRFLSVAYVKKENLVGKARFLFFSNDGSIGNFFTFWKWHRSIRFDRILKKII